MGMEKNNWQSILIIERETKREIENLHWILESESANYRVESETFFVVSKRNGEIQIQDVGSCC